MQTCAQTYLGRFGIGVGTAVWKSFVGAKNQLDQCLAAVEQLVHSNVALVDRHEVLDKLQLELLHAHVFGPLLQHLCQGPTAQKPSRVAAGLRGAQGQGLGSSGVQGVRVLQGIRVREGVKWRTRKFRRLKRGSVTKMEIRGL